jgi:hypothetical protein
MHPDSKPEIDSASLLESAIAVAMKSPHADPLFPHPLSYHESPEECFPTLVFENGSLFVVVAWEMKNDQSHPRFPAQSLLLRP